jgi:hypothetical protein
MKRNEIYNEQYKFEINFSARYVFIYSIILADVLKFQINSIQ